MSTPNVQSLPRPIYSPRGCIVLVSCRPDSVVVTVEAYPKWYGLILLHPEVPVPFQRPYQKVEEVPFPDHDTLTPYIDHVPNPKVVKAWAEKQGYVVDELAFEMMVGRWHLSSGEGEP